MNMKAVSTYHPHNNWSEYFDKLKVILTLTFKQLMSKSVAILVLCTKFKEPVVYLLSGKCLVRCFNSVDGHGDLGLQPTDLKINGSSILCDKYLPI